LSLSVYLPGIKDRVSHRHQTAVPDLLVETRPVSGMAGRTSQLFHLHEYRVSITVNEGIFQQLDVTRRLTLEPELIPGSAPVVDFTRLEGPLPRFSVHIGQHEDFTCLVVLRNDGEKPFALFKIKIAYTFHEGDL
jgi:hypothetical protein